MWLFFVFVVVFFFIFTDLVLLFLFSLQATVFFDGMRRFYEQELEEVNSESNFAYESWSSSLVTCFRLWDEWDKKHSDAKYYFQRVKRSEELESRF